MEYQIVKLIHIISSTILFGTGIGTAFFMFMANRRKSIAEIHFATRIVVIADWVFTTPAIIIQLATGLWLVELGGHSLSDKWIVMALMLYVFTGACWVPVVWMQIKMRDNASAAYKTNENLPKQYWTMERYWTILGALAFPAVVLIFYLMVMKPV